MYVLWIFQNLGEFNFNLVIGSIINDNFLDERLEPALRVGHNVETIEHLHAINGNVKESTENVGKEQFTKMQTHQKFRGTGRDSNGVLERYVAGWIPTITSVNEGINGARNAGAIGHVALACIKVNVLAPNNAIGSIVIRRAAIDAKHWLICISVGNASGWKVSGRNGRLCRDGRWRGSLCPAAG